MKKTKKTNHFAVAACATGFAAAVCTLIFLFLLGIVAVAGIFTPYTLWLSAVLGVYLCFLGFTLFLLVASAVVVLIFTLLKRRNLNRIFLGVEIAAAALNLAALLLLLLPIIVFWPPEDSVLMLVSVAIAPSAACIADIVLTGLAIAALCKESRLLRDESTSIDFGE